MLGLGSEAHRRLRAGERLGVATVIGVPGSAPRGVGASGGGEEGQGGAMAQRCPDVTNLRGGIVAWLDADGPVIQG